MVRAISTLSLGYNINVEEISDIRSAAWYKNKNVYTYDINSNEESMINNIFNWMKSKLNPTGEISHSKVYTKSFIYEPGVTDHMWPKINIIIHLSIFFAESQLYYQYTGKASNQY